jgi:AraC family transcriptional regulator
MARELPHKRVSTDGPRIDRLSARSIAAGEGWTVSKFICAAGPGDRPFEERHDGYTIAAVLAGTFTYSADSGRALLHPGAMLLGNDGKCFECNHEHGVGDRCISFNFSRELFCEIAATAGGTSRYAFSAPMLPVGKRSIPVLALIDAIARDPDPLRVEEVAIRLVETVVSTFSDRAHSPMPPVRRETRRIAEVVRHIEAHVTEPLDLATLAALANVSKYHFLRTFRRAIGMTPYQYLLAARVRRAASRLAGSSDTVTSIAFGNGFGDLSTFNSRFRSIFGVCPTAYRATFTRRPSPLAGEGPKRSEKDERGYRAELDGLRSAPARPLLPLREKMSAKPTDEG